MKETMETLEDFPYFNKENSYYLMRKPRDQIGEFPKSSFIINSQ